MTVVIFVHSFVVESFRTYTTFTTTRTILWCCKISKKEQYVLGNSTNKGGTFESKKKNRTKKKKSKSDNRYASGI
jgi:hypothetical protein